MGRRGRNWKIVPRMARNVRGIVLRMFRGRSDQPRFDTNYLVVLLSAGMPAA